MDHQEAGNNYDMLKGCVNRIFVTDNKDELVSLYTGALHYLSLLFLYGKERFSERSEKTNGDRIRNMTDGQLAEFLKSEDSKPCTHCQYNTDDIGCVGTDIICTHDHLTDVFEKWLSSEAVSERPENTVYNPEATVYNTEA